MNRADAGDGWIPVSDADLAPARAPVPGGAAKPADVPASERVAREFLRAPEGELRAGSLVVRPSLWAALERSVTVLAGLLVLFVPLGIGLVFGVDVEDGGPSGPQWLRLLDLSQTLIFPLFAAIAPAIQLVFTRYIFDDEGIRERVQFFSKTERRVQWDKVTALRHRHTILDRLFGVGRVDVIAYGERGTTLKLVGLKHPAHLRDLVAGQMRASASVEQLFRND